MKNLLEEKRRLVEAAAGTRAADLVLKNAAYVNVFSGEILCGDIAVAAGRVAGVGRYRGNAEIDVSGKIVLPGFIDAHIHLESSMVSPAEFARAVLPHGTAAVVADPHEIANVMGTDGIEYMLQATEGLPVDVRVMLPSCVPAAPADESGAELDWRAIDSFYAHPRVLGLAEMMNYVGVVGADESVLEKIVAAQIRGKMTDGHAPGLAGNALNAYVAAGIYSDHECSGLDEALAKLERGQFIMIREGTAAPNLKALAPLLTEKYASRCMLCCDDRHPGDLLEKGHIDAVVREAIRLGADPAVAVKAASLNAAQYFRMSGRGAIAPGYAADLVVIDNFSDFRVEKVFRNGVPVFADGAVAAFDAPKIDPALVRRARDTFHSGRLTAADFTETRSRGVIGIVPGEIITENLGFAERVDTEKNILKIAVVERHRNTGHIGIGYIRGYGLKSGAVATSVAHDSHNIIVVGASDADMALAASRVAENRGGFAVAERGNVVAELVLGIAGLMSEDSLENVSAALERAKSAAFRLGVSEKIDPFMTLGFMSLPVIPALRLTTRGVFDVLKNALQ